MRRERDDALLNEAHCMELRDCIKNTECQMQRLERNIDDLSQEVQKLKQERSYSIERLQEMKEAIAYLKKSIHSWNVLLENVKHGGNRAAFVLNVVQRALKSKDPKKRLGSQGMETALEHFVDAFTTVKHLFEKQWQFIISYDFTCDMCHRQQRGLPLPVDDNTTVCFSCAQTLVQ